MAGQGRVKRHSVFKSYGNCNNVFNYLVGTGFELIFLKSLLKT